MKYGQTDRSQWGFTVHVCMNVHCMMLFFDFFQLLSLVTPSQADVLTITAEKHAQKNRSRANLPR